MAVGRVFRCQIGVLGLIFRQPLGADFTGGAISKCQEQKKEQQYPSLLVTTTLSPVVSKCIIQCRQIQLYHHCVPIGFAVSKIGAAKKYPGRDVVAPIAKNDVSSPFIACDKITPELIILTEECLWQIKVRCRQMFRLIDPARRLPLPCDEMEIDLNSSFNLIRVPKFHVLSQKRWQVFQSR